MKLYIAERKRRLLREQMKKRRYLEMAKINLSLALEHQRLESEAARIYELPVTE